MTAQTYVECFLVALLGMAISTLLILNSLSRKARLANLEFSFKGYFRDEVFLIGANFLWVIVCMLCINFFMNWRPEWSVFVVPGFFPIGYLGSDVASRLASVANKRLNLGIDSKTTQIDTLNNTLAAPTPATLPTDKANKG